HWHQQDVSKWVGQFAYIELLDDGDGYMALEKVVFSDGPAPEESPNALAIERLGAAQASPADVAGQYQTLISQAFGDWLSHPNSLSDHAADRAAIVNWVFEHLAPAGSAGDTQNQLAERLATIDRQREAVESQFAPPRQALALTDSGPLNERVFIRG